jgi:thymidylate synthase (FAD)
MSSGSSYYGQGNPKVVMVANTIPVKGDYGRTAEEFIAYCARVSNPSNQGSHDTSSKLVRYLADNHHWSPFEMASIVLDITTTRDIARQILRHRSFSFQEFSQRYGHAMSFHPGRELRWQDKANRQNSLEVNLADESASSLADEWQRRQRAVVELARENYEWALQQGIAKEVARSVLPEGLTTSRIFMTGSLRSWIHYVQIRCHPSTQKEHREVALLCASEIAKVLPSIRQFMSAASSADMEFATAVSGT